jgi:hypothetical protein
LAHCRGLLPLAFRALAAWGLQLRLEMEGALDWRQFDLD